jgi:hypothetical protein
MNSHSDQQWILTSSLGYNFESYVVILQEGYEYFQALMHNSSTAKVLN